jgi:hypothetical protein
MYVKMVVLRCSKVANQVESTQVEFQTLIRFVTSEPGVKFKNKMLNNALIGIISMFESHLLYLLHEKMEERRPHIFDIFKPLPKIFKCIYWLNGSFLRDNQRGFLEGSLDSRPVS